MHIDKIYKAIKKYINSIIMVFTIIFNQNFLYLTNIIYIYLAFY